MKNLSCYTLRSDLLKEPGEIFKTVAHLASWLEEMRDFKDTDRRRLQYGAFFAIGPMIGARQSDFSRHYKISENSLTKWKSELQVMKARNLVMDYCLESERGNILYRLLEAALWTSKRTGRGDVRAMKLFLEYVELGKIDGVSISSKQEQGPDRKTLVNWSC